MSYILQIDSSLENASVSISRNGNLVKFLSNNIQKDHSSFLHIAIKEVLTYVSLAPHELDAIAVTAGPGSYTGLRVGFAAAKGLTYSLQKPLISVGTLELMAKSLLTNHPDANGLIVPMIDARRSEVFTALYSNRGVEIIPPHAMIVGENSFVTEMQLNDIYFTGNGAEKFKAITSNSRAFFVDHGELTATFSRLSFEKFLSQKFESLSLSAPLYGKDFYGA